MNNTFLLEIQELKCQDNIHFIQVKWYYTIKNIKDTLSDTLNVNIKSLYLFHASSPLSLKNTATLHDLGIDTDGHCLALSIISDSSKYSSFTLTIAGDNPIDDNCDELLINVKSGLQRQQLPKKTDCFDCTGGVYFMRGVSGSYIGVYKPKDEEQGMMYNDKGHAGNGEIGLRKYIKPGQGCIREVAAYILDVDNFCSVPPTTLVYFEHSSLNYKSNSRGHIQMPMYPKCGSLQKFISAHDSYENLSSSIFSDFEVQKIALLDMRYLNCDRNSSNLLVLLDSTHSDHRYRRAIRSSSVTSQDSSGNEGYRRGNRSTSVTSQDSNGNESHHVSENYLEFGTDDDYEDNESTYMKSNGVYTLVPIDHGYCFPTKLHVEDIDWTWFNCQQVKNPVHPEIKAYMLALDIDAAIAVLRETVSLPEESINLIRLTHYLIVEGLKCNLTLREIACIIARVDDLDTPSTFEKLINEAEDNSHKVMESKTSRISASLNDKVDQSISMVLNKRSTQSFGGGIVTSPMNTVSIVDSGNTSTNENSDDKEFLNNGSDHDREKAVVSPSLVDNIHDNPLAYAQMARSFEGATLKKLTSLCYSDICLSPQLQSKTSKSVKFVHSATKDTSAAPREENETDVDENSPLSKQSSPIDKPVKSSLSLVRVASFAGFESASFYEIDDEKERRCTTLTRQRRKLRRTNSEWINLFFTFIMSSIKSVIMKTSKCKFDKLDATLQTLL